MLARFFTNQISREPILTLQERTFLLLALAILIYLSFRYYQKAWYRTFFWWLQCVQLVSLYSWYLWVGWPLSGSLPLYHCRIAMFVLLWARSGRLKRYFAYLGVFGSVIALIYPVFDPFYFPHITLFSFVLGHYALVVNSLIYLLSHPSQTSLAKRLILAYTVGMNLIMLLANAFWGGNYGFLARTPLLQTENVFLNFILITSLLVMAVSLVQLFFQALYKKKELGFST